MGVKDGWGVEVEEGEQQGWVSEEQRRAGEEGKGSGRRRAGLRVGRLLARIWLQHCG